MLGRAPCGPLTRRLTCEQVHQFDQSRRALRGRIRGIVVDAFHLIAKMESPSWPGKMGKRF
jgi:hypothetical protein